MTQPINIESTMTARIVRSAPPENTEFDETTGQQSEQRQEMVSQRASWPSLVLNTSCIIIYGYAIYFQNFHHQGSLLNVVIDPRLQSYGLWKFLTYHSLILQFASSCLHIVALRYPGLRTSRDLLFTSLAYPIGSLVEYTFWAVWWTQGRDLIFPQSLELYYPVWLNHITHTIIVPLNIAQAYLTLHRHIKRGFLVTLTYAALYWIYVMYIRFRTGVFVYLFMNEMSITSMVLYIASIIFCFAAIYETGFFMTGLFHLKEFRRLSRQDSDI